MNMIGHQVSFLDSAFLAAGQIVEYRPQMRAQLYKNNLLAILRRKNDVILALPRRVVKMIVL